MHPKYSLSPKIHKTVTHVMLQRSYRLPNIRRNTTLHWNPTLFGQIKNESKKNKNFSLLTKRYFHQHQQKSLLFSFQPRRQHYYYYENQRRDFFTLAPGNHQLLKPNRIHHHDDNKKNNNNNHNNNYNENKEFSKRHYSPPSSSSAEQHLYEFSLESLRKGNYESFFTDFRDAVGRKDVSLMIPRMTALQTYTDEIRFDITNLRQLILKYDAYQAIDEVMKHHFDHHDIQVIGLAILFKWLTLQQQQQRQDYDSYNNKDYVSSHELILTLFQTMKHHVNNVEIHSTALTVMNLLITTSIDRLESLIRHDVYQLISQVMHRYMDNADLQTQACALLGNIIAWFTNPGTIFVSLVVDETENSVSKENNILEYEPKIHALLIESMERHISNVKVQSTACEAMKNFFWVSDEAAYVLIENNVHLLVLRSVEYHFSSAPDSDLAEMLKFLNFLLMLNKNDWLTEPDRTYANDVIMRILDERPDKKLVKVYADLILQKIVGLWF